MPRIATEEHLERAALLEFVAARHQGVLITTRADGRPQASPVTMGLSGDEILVSTYPSRAKVHNLRRNPAASMLVLSDGFDPWVQVYGTAAVVDLPDAVEGLVEYFRVIRGDHPDWDEYRQAMVDQGKCLVRLGIEDWGPVARGGFPADVAARMEASGG